LEVSPHGVITRIAVRVNMNIKSDTTIEFEERKKSLHLLSFEYLIEELERDLHLKLSDSATIERAKGDDHCVMSYLLKTLPKASWYFAKNVLSSTEP
jgi:hypothetical protein